MQFLMEKGRYAFLSPLWGDDGGLGQRTMFILVSLRVVDVLLVLTFC